MRTIGGYDRHVKYLNAKLYGLRFNHPKYFHFAKGLLFDVERDLFEGGEGMVVNEFMKHAVENNTTSPFTF